MLPSNVSFTLRRPSSDPFRRALQMKDLSRNKQLVSLSVLALIVCASATQTELANVSPPAKTV